MLATVKLKSKTHIILIEMIKFFLTFESDVNINFVDKKQKLMCEDDNELPVIYFHQYLSIPRVRSMGDQF